MKYFISLKKPVFALIRKGLYVFLLLNFIHCKDDDDPALPEVPQHGTVRDKGTPAGDIVQKTIGPEGGIIATADRRIAVTVPAGAVTSATNFSIQPVTNTLPGSPGTAYRLLPEGQTFEKPVTLTFHYQEADLRGTSAQLLFAAYQGTDGVWKFLPETALDENKQTLTVNTKHFSDWGIFAEFWLQGANRQLEPGKSADIELMSPFFLPGLTDADKELEIADVRPLDKPENIKNWQLFGDGNLKASGTRATYTAPGKIPAVNPVQISVEVYNFIPPSYAPRPGAKGKAIISDNIYITDDTYFIAEVDGTEYIAVDKGFIPSDDFFVVAGNIYPNTKGISLIINRSPYNATGTYPYSDGHGNENGEAIAGLLPPSGDGYFSNYDNCDGDAFASGYSVSITKSERIGEKTYLTGTFRATLYQEEGSCVNGTKIVREKSISGKFRVSNLLEMKSVR